MLFLNAIIVITVIITANDGEANLAPLFGTRFPLSDMEEQKRKRWLY